MKFWKIRHWKKKLSTRFWSQIKSVLFCYLQSANINTTHHISLLDFGGATIMMMMTIVLYWVVLMDNLNK